MSASDDIYRIVEVANANLFDVFKYFELLLTILPKTILLTAPDIFEKLLLWNKIELRKCKTV